MIFIMDDVKDVLWRPHGTTVKSILKPKEVLQEPKTCSKDRLPSVRKTERLERNQPTENNVRGCAFMDMQQN